MIKQGDKIINARTGQSMLFLRTAAETNGEVLEIECISPPSLAREPEHIHPVQENIFKIISGTCNFSIDGKEQVAGPGRTIRIPPNTRHYFWNATDMDVHYVQEFRPALQIADFFDTFFALSRDGKLNEKGLPNFFLMSLIGLKHRNEIRVLNPPWPIQLVTFIALAPIGLLLGYKPGYSSKG